VKLRVSFPFVAVVIFIALTAFQCNVAGTNADENASFGWLQFHRHGEHWSFVRLEPGVLAADMFLSVGLTWIVSKMHGFPIAT
jgi:hypothetical protein